MAPSQDNQIPQTPSPQPEIIPQPIMPTPNNVDPGMMVTPQKSKKILPILLLILVFVGVGVAAFFIMGKKLPFLSPSVQPSPSPILKSPSPSPIATPTPTATGSASPAGSSLPKASGSPGTIILTKSCQNEVIKISLKIPSSWTCKSETPAPSNGTIIATSSLFELNISNLGRGAPCQANPEETNYDPECKAVPFYSNSILGVDFYTQKSVNKEIYGRFKTGDISTPWVGVKYKDMTTKQLTASQKEELTTVLEGITLIK